MKMFGKMIVFAITFVDEELLMSRDSNIYTFCNRVLTSYVIVVNLSNFTLFIIKTTLHKVIKKT